MTPEQLKSLRLKLKLIPDSDKKSHEELRDLIRAETEQVDDATVRETWELFGCFDEDEYRAAVTEILSTGNKPRAVVIGHLLSMGRWSATNAALRKAILFAFGDGKTLAAVRRLSKRNGSIADSINLPGVTESDVADALLRTAD